MFSRANHTGISRKSKPKPELSGSMGEVRLTLEEYEALRRIQSSERESEGSRLALRRRKRTRKGKAPSGMSRSLREANRRGRKKNGELKKGWSQAKIMATAHRIRKRKR